MRSGKPDEVRQVRSRGAVAAGHVGRRADERRPARRRWDRRWRRGCSSVITPSTVARTSGRPWSRTDGVAVAVDRAARRLALEEIPARRIRTGAVGRVAAIRSDCSIISASVLREARLQRGEVGADLHRELGVAHGGVELALGVEQPLREAHVDDGGAGGAQRRERRLDHPVHLGVLAHEVAGDADARALERVGVQVLRVVASRSGPRSSSWPRRPGPRRSSRRARRRRRRRCAPSVRRCRS